MNLGRALDLAILGVGKNDPEAPRLSVQPASILSAEEVERARFVPVRALETTVPGAALIPTDAPDAVVKVVRGVFSWRKALHDLAGWGLVFLWTYVIPLAVDQALVQGTSPGFIESITLPPWLEWVDRPLLFGLLVVLRDYRRYKHKAA